MSAKSTQELTSYHTTLLAWCIAGSVAAHVFALTVMPGWKKTQETLPVPLTVELREPPPKIEPPKLLPMESQPVVKARVKPVAEKPAPREERPVERVAPILTAAPEAPVAPAAPVVPEQKPVPPEPPRPPPAPVAAPTPPVPPAPVTPPRSDAAYLNNPIPAYPLAARRRGDQGTVMVRVLVTAQGLAARVGLAKSSGHSSLDEAALVAVKSWRFEPARQGGQAIESQHDVPVVFKLD
jgi:periplasmic protein TonB